MAITSTSHSQSADAFNPNAGGTVSTIVVETDGNVLMGGSFSSLGGQTRRCIGRVFADGALDTNFNVNITAIIDPTSSGPLVACMALQRDRKILLGGFLHHINGVPRNHIGRLNNDGTLDTVFNPNPNDIVFTMAMQPDGKILVGGAFTNIAGGGRKCLVRLETNGTLDPTFNPQFYFPTIRPVVSAVAVQADGKILVSGNFEVIGGQTRYRLGRLQPDGSLDTTFNAGFIDTYVLSMVTHPDGLITIGGDFTVVGGQARNRIAQLNTNGTLVTSFNPNASGGVSTIALQTDGRVLVGGSFTNIAGVMRSNLVRLNSNGTINSAFTSTADGRVNTLAIQPDGKILAGGTFLNLGGAGRNRIGRLTNSPTFENLWLNDSTVTWSRAGTAPEVVRPEFHISTDGTDWSALGFGTRITDGWEIGGVSAPAGSMIRARAAVSSGARSAFWCAERIVHIGPSIPSTILLNDGNFGFSSNRFGFSASGSAGRRFIVDYSTNLADWTPLTTNAFATNSVPVRDAGSTNKADRFYRLR